MLKVVERIKRYIGELSNCFRRFKIHVLVSLKNSANYENFNLRRIQRDISNLAIIEI